MEERFTVNKVGVNRYVFINVALPLLVVFMIVVMGFVSNGLYERYLLKKVEVRRFAKVLAASAALENYGLVAVQVSQSINQDPVIRDIHFYSIDDDIDLDDHIYDNWENALFNDSVSFYEGVMVAIDDNESYTHMEHKGIHNGQSHPVHLDSYRNAALDSDANTALVGYINITLDLKEFRRQWFKQNYIALSTLPLMLLAFLALIYMRLRLPVRQIVNMSEKSKQVLSQDKMELGSIIHSEKGFDELEAIRQLIIRLDNRYKELVIACNTTNQYKDVEKQARHAKSHNTALQSMIIHELKSSLNDISDGLQLLDNQYISNEQTEAIATIRKGNEELEFTLNQIIQLDLIDKGLVGMTLSELHPSQLINSLIQDYQDIATKLGLTLTAKIKHVDHILAGDDRKIRSILEELMCNAIKYTKKGSISITSKMDYFPDCVRWTVDVADTGIGIDQNHLDDIFLPFFRVNPDRDYEEEAVKDNTGIGLGVAHRLTKLLNGELSVKSKKGRGSTFTLVLQLRDWRYDEVFRVLSGVNIVGLENENNASYMRELTTYGASIHIISDMLATLEYLSHTPADILLISDDIDVDEVEELCIALRELERSRRTLIAWYNADTANKTKARLEAIGLDYIIDPTKPFKDQASLIKSWLLG